MKRRHIKYAGFVLLCVAGCMLMTACNHEKKTSTEKQDSVISSEAESQDTVDDAKKSGSQNDADDTKQSGAQNTADNVQKSEAQDATTDETVDPANYEVGTREHYIADIAQEQGIPYDTADEQEKQEAEKIMLNDGEFIGVQKDGNQSTITTVGKKFATNFFYKDVLESVNQRALEIFSSNAIVSGGDKIPSTLGIQYPQIQYPQYKIRKSTFFQESRID